MIEIIYLLSQLVLALLLLYWASAKPTRFLYWAAFLIPLQGLGIDLGIDRSWYELLSLIAVFGTLLGGRRLILQPIPGRNIVIVFLTYIAFQTMIMWWVDLTTTQYYVRGQWLGWAAPQTVWRYPVQIFSYMLVWSLPLIGFWYVKNQADLRAVASGYVNGAVFNVVIGFYQVIALSLGLPWLDRLGITFLDASLTARTVLTHQPFVIHRLFGLGIEPRHTALFTLMAITLLFSSLISGFQLGIRHQLAKFVVLLIGILLTGSTSGLTGLGLVFAGGLILSWFSRTSKNRVLSTAGVSLIVIILTLSLQIPTVNGIFQLRIVDRLSGGVMGAIENEPKDVAFLQFAQSEPMTLLIGTGAGGIDFRLIPYTDLNFLTYGATVTPGFLGFRLLGDFGVVIIIMFLFLLARWWRYLAWPDDWMSNFVILGGFALLNTTSSGLPGYLLMCSSLVAAKWGAKQRLANDEVSSSTAKLSINSRVPIGISVALVRSSSQNKGRVLP